MNTSHADCSCKHTSALLQQGPACPDGGYDSTHTLMRHRTWCVETAQCFVGSSWKPVQTRCLKQVGEQSLMACQAYHRHSECTQHAAWDNPGYSCLLLLNTNGHNKLTAKEDLAPLRKAELCSGAQTSSSTEPRLARSDSHT